MSKPVSMLVTAFVSLVLMKSFVLWMGANYSAEPTRENLFYFIGAIFCSLFTLGYFLWKYSKR